SDGRRFRPAAAPRHRLPGQLPRAVVAKIGLLRAASGVGKVEAHRRALSLADFAVAVVADEYCLACQVAPPRCLGFTAEHRRETTNTTHLFAPCVFDAQSA